MKTITRRSFIRKSAITAAAVSAVPFININPLAGKSDSDLVLRPYPHQWMPEFDRVYLTDVNEDPFVSAVKVNRDGVVIPHKEADKKFSINAKWFVEGFGYITLGADNGGELYSSGDFPKNSTLNYEFAKSRVIRNRNVKKKYENSGTGFSHEVSYLTSLSEELFEDAAKYSGNIEKSVKYADKALQYALWCGELIELERAKSEIERQKRKDRVYLGCETRQYIWAKSEDMTKRFEELFNFATITHYVWDTWYELFEPREGIYNWGIKDNIVNWLSEKNITIQGRPLFWFHPIVTPDWLKNKNFSELKTYVEKHTKDLITHYGDKVTQWEVVNEYHDWANIHNHTPEQITEIVRLACDKTKETNPDVVKILNNCAPWGEYAAMGRMARMDATRPLRSPRKFIQDLSEADIDYDVLGIQVYFPYRDLSDIVRMLERFEKFNKPIYITELGTSSGPSKAMVAAGDMNIPDGPYDWHRHWDEELQADWLEQVYSVYYSRPSIKAINWYDFSDFRPHIKNGGLIREDSSKKRSFDRLKSLLDSWGRLP
ncbi:MAG: endo-1,4-beta-xylanase [Ignavibacteriaceae bacterium]